MAATPSTTNPYGAGPIDPPAPNEPVLVVKGGQNPLSLTMDQLDAMGNTTVTLDEPFVKKRQTFSGVPLATLMAKAGIPNTATLETVALNDYHYSSPLGPMVDSLHSSQPNETAHRSPTTRAVRFASCFPTAPRCRRTSTRGTGASRRSR